MSICLSLENHQIIKETLKILIILRNGSTINFQLLTIWWSLIFVLEELFLTWLNTQFFLGHLSTLEKINLNLMMKSLSEILHFQWEQMELKTGSIISNKDIKWCMLMTSSLQNSTMELTIQAQELSIISWSDFPLTHKVQFSFKVENLTSQIDFSSHLLTPIKMLYLNTPMSDNWYLSCIQFLKHTWT